MEYSTVLLDIMPLVSQHTVLVLIQNLFSGEGHLYAL